jgi:hypothetical protein
MRLAVTCPFSAHGLAEGRTGLSGGVKTKHQQAHFLAAEDLGQRARECGAHGECVVLWCSRLRFRWLSWSMLDALGADVRVLSFFLAGSRRAMLILLCDNRSVAVLHSETAMDSGQTALETFDPARGSPGVAFGTRSVVKLDYTTRYRE